MYCASTSSNDPVLLAEYNTMYGQAKGPTDYGSQEGKLDKASAKYEIYTFFLCWTFVGLSS